MLLHEVETNPQNERSWWKLLAFPMLVCHRLPRGGADNAAYEFNKRSKAFTAQQYHALWKQARDVTLQNKTPAAPAAQQPQRRQGRQGQQQQQPAPAPAPRGAVPAAPATAAAAVAAAADAAPPPPHAPAQAPADAAAVAAQGAAPAVAQAAAQAVGAALQPDAPAGQPQAADVPPAPQHQQQAPAAPVAAPAAAPAGQQQQRQQQRDDPLDDDGAAVMPARNPRPHRVGDVRRHGFDLGFDTDVADIDDVPPESIKRALRFAHQGNLSRGISALGAAEVALPTPENLAKMQELHPQSPPPAGTPLPKVRLDIDDFHSKDVKGMLRSFPPCSAAGLSGLTPGLLLQFANNPASGICGPLAAVINLIAHGNVPPLARRFLFGARLCGLLKKDGGIRPVACGDTMRRMAGKWLARQIRSKLGGLMPHQVGVGLSNGADVAVHSMRCFVGEALNRAGRDEQFCIAAIDIKNAFNTLDRGFMLKSIAELAPDLLNYALAAYSMPSLLSFGGKLLASSTGPHQGDPLGSLFFSLALATIMTEPRMADLLTELRTKFAYIDDLNLAGRFRDVRAAMEHFTRLAAAAGLQVNERKTVLYAPTDLELPATPFPRQPINDLVVLGVPCGPMDDALRVLAPSIDKWRAQLNVIGAIERKHIALAMLHFCASGAKANHLMRGLGPAPIWKPCDEMIHVALESICGVKLPAAAALQATLRITDGGLGIRLIEPHAPVAYCTALRRTIENESVLCNRPHTEMLRNHAIDVAEHSPELATFPKAQGLLVSFLRLERTEVAPRDMQRKVSTEVETARIASLHALFAQTPTERRDRARLAATSAKGSGLWLYGSVFSSAGRLWLDDGAFMAAIRLRLGLPLGPAVPCVLCLGKCVSDELGDHTLSCTAGGQKTLLHQSVLDEVFKLSEKAGAMPKREAHPFPGVDAGMRLDVVIRLPGSRDTAELCDVAITHALAAGHLTGAYATTPAGAATAYESVKTNKYAAAVARAQQSGQRIVLRPLVFDTFGALSTNCAVVVKQLAKLAGRRVGLAESTAVRNALHRLNFTVVLGTARVANMNAAALCAQP